MKGFESQAFQKTYHLFNKYLIVSSHTCSITLSQYDWQETHQIPFKIFKHTNQASG